MELLSYIHTIVTSCAEPHAHATIINELASRTADIAPSLNSNTACRCPREPAGRATEQVAGCLPRSWRYQRCPQRGEHEAAEVLSPVAAGMHSFTPQQADVLNRLAARSTPPRRSTRRSSSSATSSSRSSPTARPRTARPSPRSTCARCRSRSVMSSTRSGRSSRSSAGTPAARCPSQKTRQHSTTTERKRRLAHRVWSPKR